MYDYVVSHFGTKFDAFGQEGSFCVVIQKITTKSSFDLLPDIFFLRCSISKGLQIYFLHSINCILCTLDNTILRP